MVEAARPRGSSHRLVPLLNVVRIGSLLLRLLLLGVLRTPEWRERGLYLHGHQQVDAMVQLKELRHRNSPAEPCLTP